MTMLRLPTLALTVALAVLAGCATEPTGESRVFHADGMTGATPAGARPDHVLRYGDYAATQVKPAGTPSMPVAANCLTGCRRAVAVVGLGTFRDDFKPIFDAAAHPQSFLQEGPGGVEAIVLAVDEPSRQAPVWAARWFDVPAVVGGPATFDTTLVGSLESPDGKPLAWRFVVMDAGPQRDAAQAAGWIVDDGGRRVVLKSRGPGAGFDFAMNGQAVGRVELLPSAIVWLKDDLAPDVKLALAGFSSAVLQAPRAK